MCVTNSPLSLLYARSYKLNLWHTFYNIFKCIFLFLNFIFTDLLPFIKRFQAIIIYNASPKYDALFEERSQNHSGHLLDLHCRAIPFNQYRISHSTMYWSTDLSTIGIATYYRSFLTQFPDRKRNLIDLSSIIYRYWQFGTVKIRAALSAVWTTPIWKF